MSLKVTFELDNNDLHHFRAIMKRAQESAEQADEAAIIVKARDLLEQMQAADVPDFVEERIEKLDSLIAMVEDEEWKLAGPERSNVLAALSYFIDPEDIIPDAIPVLGYIDDAIMIELVMRELQHETDAFLDFCRYRAEEKARNRNPNLSRAEYLTLKRHQLHQRLRRRRQASRRRSEGNRLRFRLF